MAELPPVETVDDAMKRASDALNSLKRAKPSSAAEGRMRAAELVRQQKELLDAAHRISDAAASKRYAGNGHAKGNQDDVLSDGVLDALASALVPFMREMINDMLEKRHVLMDGGTWNPEKSFRPGDVTTYRNAMWVSRQASTNVRPGTSDHWRLMERAHK